MKTILKNITKFYIATITNTATVINTTEWEICNHQNTIINTLLYTTTTVPKEFIIKSSNDNIIKCKYHDTSSDFTHQIRLRHFLLSDLKLYILIK